MFLVSPIANSIMFKNLADGDQPNKWNTLHENLKHGNAKIEKYWQKFNNGETVSIQFVSDSATVPALKIFNPALAATIAPTTTSSIIGDETRYYYTFQVDLTAYNNSCIQMTVVSGAVTLTSEPIQVLDLTDDIADGVIKYVKYTNLGRIDSDLTGYFINWADLDFMFFYIEGQTKEVNQEDTVTTLKGSQSQYTVSSSLFTGSVLNTDPVPVYMVDRMAAVSSLYVFMVEGLRYNKPEGIDSTLFGGTTSFQMSINLIEPDAIGINVDDLGIETTEDMEWHKEYSSPSGGVSANFDIEEPDGYIVSSIMIKHDATSVAAETDVKIGYSVGAGDIAKGTVKKSATRPTGFNIVSRGSFDAASRIYFTFSGAAGYKLIVKVLFELNDIS